MGLHSLLSPYLKELATTFVAMFVIADPFAVVPVYLTITEKLTYKEQEIVCRKACVIAGVILLTFSLLGTSIFRLFGISLPAFQIAGGLLLLLLGLAQLNASRGRVREDETNESLEREDVSVFPLATPLLAGPGTISTVVLLSSELKGVLAHFVLALSITAVMAACYLMLRFAPLLFRAFGRTGLNLLTRIMGILLTAIAIQFIINGLNEVALQLWKTVNP
ncbi:MAG: NAAT family transporter [Oligoflexales bacterium]|nr:NAAT family transporter [Oligoflexales bacterium]